MSVSRRCPRRHVLRNGENHGNATSRFLGPALVLVFCVSQAFRDVYFGHVFQGVDFFAVILLAFLTSTILFTAIPLLRDRSAFGKLRGHLPHRA